MLVASKGSIKVNFAHQNILVHKVFFSSFRIFNSLIIKMFLSNILMKHRSNILMKSV